MPSATNANPNLVEAAVYDPVGHQSVALQAGPVVTDSSVTPPILYAAGIMTPGGVNTDNLTVAASQSFPVGTTNGTDQTNANGKGAVIFLNITAISTGTFQLVIQGKDPATTNYYTIVQDAFAITANGFYAFEVYPSVTPIASTSGTVPGTGAIRTAVSHILPKTWRVQAIVATAAVTAQVDVSYVN